MFSSWLCRMGAGLVCAVALGGVQAQTWPAPVNVVQLSASAQREVVQDWLTLVLVARQQAPDATTVQNQLTATVNQALNLLKQQVRDQLVEVSTSGLSVQPRYGKDGQVLGWQGSAELLLQGRDVARITQLAAQVRGLSVAQMRFALSPQAAAKLESDIRREAIANFRATAQDSAAAFGFSGYRLRELSIQTASNQPVRARMLASAPMAMADAEAPLPAEAGKSLVQVTVSGSVELQ